MVMEKKPNLIPDIIRKHPEDIYTAERIIANNENATLENLKYICNSKATDATPLKVRAYNTKIQSLETKPTLLESTMSISELFATKMPCGLNHIMSLKYIRYKDIMNRLVKSMLKL